MCHLEAFNQNWEMKRLLLTSLILGLASPVQAQVDPSVHNLCKDVADYAGCVKINSKNEFFNKEDVKRLKEYEEEVGPLSPKAV